MDTTQLALEAERLSKDEFFTTGLSMMRTAALEALATTDPTDADAIREYQATIRVIDDFLGLIVSSIRNGQPKKAAGIV